MIDEPKTENTGAAEVVAEAPPAAQAAQVTIQHGSAIPTDELARLTDEIVNANMAAAIRVVTVQRGIDPRAFTLVGFGGAGPMHVARLAETFEIPSIVVPWAAGVASAVGLVSSSSTMSARRQMRLTLR